MNFALHSLDLKDMPMSVMSFLSNTTVISLGSPAFSLEIFQVPSLHVLTLHL